VQFKGNVLTLSNSPIKIVLKKQAQGYHKHMHSHLQLKAKQQSAIPKVVTANKEPQLHIGAAQK
jgi:hypothetical protein